MIQNNRCISIHDSDISRLLKPHLKEYLESMGITFKGPTKFHCFIKQQHRRGDIRASAIISRNGTHYRCLACGQRGDIIDACMELESLTFPEALDKLCVAYSIDHNTTTSTRKVYSQLLEDVASYLSKRGSTDLAEMRGLTEGQCRSYGIGTLASTRLADITNSYSMEEKLETGLWKLDENKHLVMLPIFSSDTITITLKDPYGKVTGFVGRRPTGSEPKYLDPSGNNFGGKEMLFPINRAISEIRKTHTVYMVEGYFDALQMILAGIPNTVAARGGRPMDKHIDFLVNCGMTRLILMLDNDASGFNAELDILTNILIKGKWKEYKLKVFKAIFPSKFKDPDELMKETQKDTSQITLEDGFTYLLQHSKDIGPLQNLSTNEKINELVKVGGKIATSIIDVSSASKAISCKYNINYDIIEPQVFKEWIKNY